MLSIFSVRFISILIMVILINHNISIILSISEPGFNACSVFPNFVFCLLVWLVNFGWKLDKRYWLKATSVKKAFSDVVVSCGGVQVSYSPINRCQSFSEQLSVGCELQKCSLISPHPLCEKGGHLEGAIVGNFLSPRLVKVWYNSKRLGSGKRPCDKEQNDYIFKNDYFRMITFPLPCLKYGDFSLIFPLRTL